MTVVAREASEVGIGSAGTLGGACAVAQAISVRMSSAMWRGGIGNPPE